MSNSRVVSLHSIKPNVHRISGAVIHAHNPSYETLADHASHLGATSRQRARMVAHELAGRLHASIDEAKIVGRSAIMQLGVRLALRASRKLITLGEKIEQKAHAVERER